MNEKSTNLAWVAIAISLVSAAVTITRCQMQSEDRDRKVRQIQYYAYADSSWKIYLRQVTGEPYFIESLEFAGSLQSNPAKGLIELESFKIYPAKYINTEAGLPKYMFPNAKTLILEKQTNKKCPDCDLLEVELRFEVFDKSRTVPVSVELDSGE